MADSMRFINHVLRFAFASELNPTTLALVTILVSSRTEQRIDMPIIYQTGGLVRLSLTISHLEGLSLE